MFSNIIGGAAFVGVGLLGHAVLTDALGGSAVVEPYSLTASEEQTRPLRLTVLSWPIDLVGASWFVLILTLARVGRWGGANLQARIAVHTFWLTAAALSVVLLVGHQVRATGQMPRIQLLLGVVCLVVVFVASAMSRHAAMGDVARNGLRDIKSWGTQSVTWFGIAVVLTLANMAGVPQINATEVPTGSGFGAWWRLQPRLTLPIPSGDAVVQIVKFNDYQCPPCKRANQQHGEVISRLTRVSEGAVRLVTLDFPLDAECNRYVTLWEHQASLSSEAIWTAAEEIVGVQISREHYASILEDVKSDIEIGHALGVTGTPTYFVNGRRLPFVESRDFETAVLMELAESDLGTL